MVIGFSCSFSFFAFGAIASVSIKHTTCPTATASPSSAFKVITPLSSAGRSKVALSESNSAIVWSFSTKSPSFTSHSAISTSEIDSPGDGTFISNITISNIC